MGYGQRAEKQDVVPSLISLDFLIFSYFSQSSGGVRKTEFSPSSGECCRNFYPLGQGERTVGGPGRNPVTKAVGNFKTSFFEVLVISSLALDQTKSSLLKAVGCSREPARGNRGDLKQADFPGTLWGAWGRCTHILTGIGRSRSSLGCDRGK